jgi:hypothetical protein
MKGTKIKLLFYVLLSIALFSLTSCEEKEDVLSTYYLYECSESMQCESLKYGHDFQISSILLINSLDDFQNYCSDEIESSIFKNYSYIVVKQELPGGIDKNFSSAFLKKIDNKNYVLEMHFNENDLAVGSTIIYRCYSCPQHIEDDANIEKKIFIYNKEGVKEL